jgi:hypothetical protein
MTRDSQRIYSLPEVEKTSAWKDKDAAEPKIELRDFEREKAEKRTALIKERMSPPGALHLPPLLEAQRLKHGIPDGFFRSQAAFDRIYVFPLDPFDGDDKLAPGSFLHRANATKLRDMQEGNRGVIISAGLKAADVLMSHGIELGHVVTTNKNVPFARRCEVLADGTQMFFLVMREADLAGSETLAEEILAGEKRVIEVRDESGYEHQVAVNDNGEWVSRKKQSCWVSDTW